MALLPSEDCSQRIIHNRSASTAIASSPELVSTDDTTEEGGTPATPAPVLNGKRVLPYKVLMAGLKGHEVAGVYAIINKEFKRGQEGWEQCQHVGVSMFLDTTLAELLEEHGAEKVAHVRAMSFVIPNEGAMEQIAYDWRRLAIDAGGKINFDPILAAMEMSMGYDDDDEDDEDDEFMEMTAEALSMARGAPATTDGAGNDSSSSSTVLSPFDETSSATPGMPPPAATTTVGDKMEFTAENVDKVLDEIRPYLISDGGNVSVDSVDTTTRSVYLKLEGACGSCPSSTVTMQMGIERVLKENFENMGEVAQVAEEDDKPTELTYTVVETEVNRIKPAIMAMGGMVEIVKVDGEGVVELKYQGAGKVRQGLELA
eukprot:CAMPEP_0117063990 /NCGR_PEP_ID=MMETSP0472-20121206/44670_1 /TAXON_ID=693140 ORGANISM="Tiarina fusus, Strain LIS" /NCGR_SAMPLE_ID=MMETSP0472 /ASSEMBLY_ACC=CAM_ASM_000603 /LENGTH=371 /DNA_ID=CAMNT_0004783911 /DNA_START=175 /DNA_END=1286 /DNA_ORIENTATION=+